MAGTSVVILLSGTLGWWVGALQQLQHQQQRWSMTAAQFIFIIVRIAFGSPPATSRATALFFATNDVTTSAPLRVLLHRHQRLREGAHQRVLACSCPVALLG